MTWVAWTVIGLIAVFFIFDWLVVMGINPKRWKGGKKDE